MTVPRDRINEATFELIEIGMTQRELEELLGKSGDYRSGIQNTLYLKKARGVHGPYGDDDPLRWRSDSGTILIRFDIHRKVGEAVLFLPMEGQMTFFDRLRHWLGLPWW
jgi:hypothetical protein